MRSMGHPAATSALQAKNVVFASAYHAALRRRRTSLCADPKR